MQVNLYTLTLSVSASDGVITDFDLKGMRTRACKEWMEADPEFKSMVDAINVAVVKVVDAVYGEDKSSGEGAEAVEMALQSAEPTADTPTTEGGQRNES